jgi:hypothetical protein
MNSFIDTSFLYFISLNRKGRLEYLQALQATLEKEEQKNPLSMDIKR